MATRRKFLKDFAGATAGIYFIGCGLGDFAFGSPQAGGGVRRREISIGGRRVRTIDIHAHCYVPEVWEFVKATDQADTVRRTIERPETRLQNLMNVEERLRLMDQNGIDVQVLSFASGYLFYWADRDLSRQLMKLQNEKVAALCAAHPDRFVGLAGVSLQHPDLAAEQLQEAVKRLGMRGCMISCAVNGEELSAPRFGPFWAKAEELGAVVFLHPTRFEAEQSRLQGNGNLDLVIGNPFETTVALSHLIWEGTLDRYPGLKLCFCHGGGYLAASIGRSDRCVQIGNCKAVKKQPSEYLRQLYFDSLVYTAEELRHLIAQVGASQVVLGTDFSYDLGNLQAVDHVLGTPGLSDADRMAILGGNAARLLQIGSRA